MMDVSLQHKIDLNYAHKKRSNSLKWSIVNGVFLLVFVYDLSCKCSGYTSLLHYVELALAAVACANLLQHATRLLRAPPAAPHTEVLSADPGASPARGDAEGSPLAHSPGLRWRPPPPPSPARPPPSPPSPPSPRHELPLRDEFISDRRVLEAYLGQQSRQGAPPPEVRSWPASASPPPLYQLSALNTEGTLEEGGGSPSGAGAAPHVWRRLNVDPRRLTQYNFNLRLWIHVTILERVVRELDAAAALPEELRPGLAPLERLRAAARAQPRLRALLPFLELCADQQYLVRRLRALAAGGCLSEYRWRAGGPDWRPGLPADAELVLRLVAGYLDLQLPAGAARPFSAQHLSAAPASPPRGPHVLAIHRTAQQPPHYVLLRGEDTLEPGAGRNNLLHALLLFLAAAAQRDPPALQRVHLGPAALNMLWIIGR
ncbi:transmembrane protein 209 [Plodia interpunctella]|uniref:transmembrane protein 209 n=1 Tax=Plodia interpunctella TaxID=58824 RepID=UPI002367FF2C|nr:transmembrane protein 209 [Plodia interpunctella]XP_053614769.1 transmembrane protein 209 [Plodia interpunctella]